MTKRVAEGSNGMMADSTELAISLDGTRSRQMLGFKPVHPKIQVDELKRIVQGFQQDGIW